MKFERNESEVHVWSAKRKENFSFLSRDFFFLIRNLFRGGGVRFTEG